MQFHRVPLELRSLKQWVCWRYEVVNGNQTKVPYNARTGHKADIVRAGTWCSFDEAVAASEHPSYDGIGFVLTEHDPYTAIDLDNKPTNPASAEELRVHDRILDQFQSYTERSVGGRGYHIIVRGNIGNGRDRGHVGVYSKLRYITFSGDVTRDAPIADCQALLDQLIAQMPEPVTAVELVDTESPYTDAQIHDRACNARNGDKYIQLCEGDWQAMGYPSQSEADFALLAMLCFYTQDNEQVRRIFRCTALGKREKAYNSDRYLNINIGRIRAVQPKPADLDQIREDAEALLRKATKQRMGTPAVPKPPEPKEDLHPYSAPPGLVGELASYIYSSSVRPVREVSLLSAIALTAGIAGRSYNISDTGLNQYLLFVATTGTGKDDGPKGIERLISAVRPKVPMVDDFIGPGTFASGQALIRALDSKPVFVSIVGEFGITLQALNDPRAPASTLMLKRALLDLYSKSGWRNVLRSTAYSDSDKNTKTVHAPNITLLGDTTPETFFDSMSTWDVSDGLVPRMHVIEYKGQRPSRNKNSGHPPHEALSMKLADLAEIALTTRNNSTCASVQVGTDALEILDAFDVECDEHIRKRANGASVQLWNRAHLKALKLAGLVSVGCNPHNPVVSRDVAAWSVRFVRHGTESMLERFDIGDVGSGQSKQFVELRRVVSEYFSSSADQLATYKAKKEIQKAGFVPYSYIVSRASKLACFAKDRRGATRALKDTIEQLVETEVLGELPKIQASEKFRKRESLYYRADNW